MKKYRENFLVRIIFIFVLVMILLSSISFGTSNLTPIQDVSSSVLDITKNIEIISIFIVIGLPIIFFIIATIIFIKNMKNVGNAEKRINNARKHLIIILVLYGLSIIYNLIMLLLSVNSISVLNKYIGSLPFIGSGTFLIYMVINFLIPSISFAIFFIIYKLYKSYPVNAIVFQKGFVIILIITTLISNIFIAFLSVGAYLLLTLFSCGSAILIFYLYDAIIVHKAIKMNGQQYEELNKERKIIIYIFLVVVVILSILEVSCLYGTAFKISETVTNNYSELYEETKDTLEEYEKELEEENILMQEIYNNIMNTYLGEENYNSIIDNDNSFDNNYINNEITTNSINNNTLISGGVTNESPTLSDLPQLEQLVGDINEDERVSMTDLSLLKGHIVKTKVLEGSQYIAADINADGNVSMTDLSKIKSIIVGM